MKRPISEFVIRKAIAKTPEFKAFVAQFKERMRHFDSYYSSVRVQYLFKFNFTYSFCHKIFDDTMETSQTSCYLTFDNTIIADYDFVCNPSRVLAKLISQRIFESTPFDDIECYHKVENLQASCTNWHIQDMWAWSDDKVGIYHVEQECGEGWFTMPKEPELVTRDYLYIY